MVQVEEAWKLYMGLRVHFLTESYDIVKYKGQLANKKILEQRPDKLLLRASLTNLESRREVVEYCVANFLQENDDFIYSSVDDADAFYSSWLSYWKAPERNVRNCVTQIEVSMYKKGLTSLEQYVKECLHADVYMNKVSRESLCILEHQNPGLLETMTGFEKDRLNMRVKKANRLIIGRLEKMKFNFREVLEKSM